MGRSNYNLILKNEVALDFLDQAECHDQPYLICKGHISDFQNKSHKNYQIYFRIFKTIGLLQPIEVSSKAIGLDLLLFDLQCLTALLLISASLICCKLGYSLINKYQKQLTGRVKVRHRH